MNTRLVDLHVTRIDSDGNAYGHLLDLCRSGAEGCAGVQELPYGDLGRDDLKVGDLVLISIVEGADDDDDDDGPDHEPCASASARGEMCADCQRALPDDDLSCPTCGGREAHTGACTEAAQVELEVRRDRIAVLCNQVGRPDEPHTIFPRLTHESPAHTLAAWLRSYLVTSGKGGQPTSATLGGVDDLWVALAEVAFAETGDNGGDLTEDEHAWIAALANVAARRSRRGGAPRLTAESSRQTLIAWLSWNDPNGCWDDASATREGCEPLDLDGAWSALVGALFVT